MSFPPDGTLEEIKRGKGMTKSEEVTISLSEMLWEQRLRGRKEVVEFIDPRMAVNELGFMQTNLDCMEWQAQKKEWGL